MSDVKCPYRGEEQEINHDYGYGYEESKEFEQDCHNCQKALKFTTSISFHYNVFCQDGDHEMEPAGDKWPALHECTKCDFFEHREPGGAKGGAA